MMTHCAPFLRIQRLSHSPQERLRLPKRSAVNSKLSKADGFTQGEPIVGQVVAIGNETEFW
jgi:hypothetical protein